jgi:aspartate 1-decarboxylase
MRKILAGKLHGATITETRLDYIGSISITNELVTGAGLLPLEEVHVWNLSNGNRLTTYVLPVPEPNTIRLNGSAAHKARAGDVVIIAAYRWVDEEKIGRYRAPVLVLGPENAIRQRMEYLVDSEAGAFEIRTL